MNKTKHGRDILKRHCQNPLITLEGVPFRCAAIWNAAVTFFDNRYLMLITIEELQGNFNIYKAFSNDGLHFTFDGDSPAFRHENPEIEEKYENRGIRDARITHVNGYFFISYIAESNHGHRIGLVKTQDFIHFKHYPYASEVDVKNGPLFPRMIGNHYCLLTRPQPGFSLWLSFSKELSFWGRDKCIMTPRGGFWDANRIGPAGPPLEVDQGWLLIYYGVKVTSAGQLVRLGATLLDKEEPWRVIARSNIPILSPRERYERFGDIPNVVFSCGGVVEDRLMHTYYGASDSCICRASAPVSDIVDICLNGHEVK